MMASLNGQLTTAELISRMQQSATAFPAPAVAPTGGTCHVAALTKNAAGDYSDVQSVDCQCTTATCGAGMLNAPAAVAAALRPIALLKSSATVGSIGQRISLDGSTSLAANGHRIAGYQWSVNPNIAVSNPNGALAEVVFPATRPITVTLTVTDETGRQDSASLTIEAALTASGSSGGGAMGIELLALLLLLAGRLSRKELNPMASVAMLCGWRGTAGRHQAQKTN
jgi:serine protease